MKENKNTGEQNTETRQELAQRYFGNNSTYQDNLGMISLLSDVQEMANLYFPESEKDHYRIILNDIKLVLIQDGREEKSRKIKWISAVLQNDENSSDDELKEYFVKNGLTIEESERVVAQREKALNDPYYRLQL